MIDCKYSVIGILCNSLFVGKLCRWLRRDPSLIGGTKFCQKTKLRLSLTSITFLRNCTWYQGLWSKWSIGFFQQGGCRWIIGFVRFQHRGQQARNSRQGWGWGWGWRYLPCKAFSKDLIGTPLQSTNKKCRTMVSLIQDVPAPLSTNSSRHELGSFNSITSCCICCF